MDSPSSRRGSALALAVLVLVALELLAHGVLLLALQERAASRAGLGLLQARAAAEAAAGAAAGAFSPAFDTLPLHAQAVVATGDVGPQRTRGVFHRLSREVWLLEGEGRVAGAPWSWRVGRLLWVLDPLARGGERPEGALLGEGVVTLAGSGTVASGGAGPRPAWCRAWEAPLDSLLPPPGPTPVGRVPEGTEPWPGVGRLGLGDLEGLLAAGEGGEGSPRPSVESGRCAEGPWNWGFPSQPDGPCGDHLVVRVFSGSLRLEGGEGQGLLVVRGDLILMDTRFEGLVLAAGDVVLRGDSEVRGQLRVGGDLEVRDTARIRGSPCHVVRALIAGGVALRRLRPLVPGGGFTLW